MTSPDTPNTDSKPAERKDDRRVDQKPGPPYKDRKNQTVDDDRRIRPDPRLDKLIEVEWEDSEVIDTSSDDSDQHSNQS